MNYLICTTQRSGKTWLCRTLKGLGVGSPEEYFNVLHKGFIKSEFARLLTDAWESKGIEGAISAIFAHQKKTTNSGQVGLAHSGII